MSEQTASCEHMASRERGGPLEKKDRSLGEGGNHISTTFFPQEEFGVP